MQPVLFACTNTIALAPEEIARQILDLDSWTGFRGYGPIPAIRLAEFEVQTPEIVGSRIRVANRDGSSHVEEIVEWQPDQRLRLQLCEFSAPLNRLATGFLETWEFERVSEGTRVTRSFAMNARSIATWPLLWMISLLLKRAIARHLRDMRTASM